jgi:hypothetical protein
MTMQIDLFRGPRYWWAAYCRRWRKMIDSSDNVFLGVVALLLGMVLLDPSINGYLIAAYWLMSLQVCYDDALNSRAYLGWAGGGLLLMVLTWSSMGSEALYVAIQLVVIGVSLMWAYTANQRKIWPEWWSRFTIRDFDPDGGASLTTEQLCVKFGLGRKIKPKLHRVEMFLGTLEAMGYVRPQPAVHRASTWLELNIGNRHLVDYYLLRGVIPPPASWLSGYIIKHDPDRKLLVRDPA